MSCLSALLRACAQDGSRYEVKRVGHCKSAFGTSARFGIQLYDAFLTTILHRHDQLHHVGDRHVSDALFIGRCTKLRQGGA